MPSKVIREWLAEYKVLTETEIHTYASTVRHNEELITELYELLEEDLAQEIVDPVCHQLFEFYRSDHKDLQRFTLEFVPTLISVYLTAHSRNEKKKCGGVEVCLLGIYNLEIVNKDGTPAVEQFTIPTLAVPSIYHESPTLAALALTESALLHYHSNEPLVITSNVLPQVETLNSQTRMTVLTHVLHCYRKDIANLSSHSHEALCKMCSKLCKTGFENLGSTQSGSGSNKRGVKFHDQPRIPISSKILVELLAGIYFVMFNGQARKGSHALDDAHQRASYELYADVLLVTNAIKNSLINNPSGQPEDGPMGIVAVSPTATNPSFAKHAITNASFRAKKLPDDIDVPEGEEEGPPPKYDDLMDDVPTPSSSEKLKGAAKISAIAGKPLKSIMKTGKAMVQSRSEGKRDKGDRDSAESSPRHSMIRDSSGLDAVDLANVQVQVVRSSSRSTVDQVELHGVSSSGSYESFKRRSGGYPAEEPQDAMEPLLDSYGKPSAIPTSHSRDIRNSLNGGDCSGSSNGSLNTQL